MYTLRFISKPGPHFLMWRVKHNGKETYYKPSDVTLVMTGCKLINKPKVSRKIFNGEKRQGCAWIRCEKLTVEPCIECEGVQIRFNPTVAPHWMDAEGENIDGATFAKVRTHKTKLLVQT